MSRTTYKHIWAILMRLWWLKTPKTTVLLIFWGLFFGLFLVIKLHRKVIETWFWYQKIDLSEYNQNKLLWGQLNNYK